MPAFDGTGPQGVGPMTGRGMGPCAMPAGRQGKGRGMGRRMGFGFGFGRQRGLGRFYGGGQAWKKEDLEDYKKALQEELEDVDKELKEEKSD